jgi:hypothetical protein
MQLKDVKSADSLKVKKVHSSFLGLSGNREVWGIYAGNQPIYRTKRGGMEGTAYYKLSADGAKVMLKELQAAVEEEKATAKTSRATKTTQKSAAAPKPRAASAAPSAALTVSGCSKFLRDKGYSVSKKKAAKRKDAEVDDLADYYTSLGAENNPRRRRRKNRSNVPSADRGGTYVMFWDDPNGPDPIVFTSSKGEDATYKAIQSDALYDYEDRAYGQIKPMRADAALLLLEQQMLRADSDGYDEGQRYQYNRVLAAVNAYKRRVTPAQAKKKVQTALRDFVHPFEEGPVYGNPRALRRLR